MRRPRGEPRAAHNSEGLGKTEEESATCAILRREHADPAAITDLVVGVADIDDVAAHRQTLDADVGQVVAQRPD